MISRRSVLTLAACTALGAVGCSKTEEYTGPELILRYAENQPEDWGPSRASSSRCSTAASTLPASL